jgi:hypothetical protein
VTYSKLLSRDLPGETVVNCKDNSSSCFGQDLNAGPFRFRGHYKSFGQNTSMLCSCVPVISGSPVATSLCEGESVKKHVALLSIYKKHFRVEPIALRTVRPFVFDNLVLADCTIDCTTEKPSEEVRFYSCSLMVITTYMEEISDSLKSAKCCLC